MSREAPLSELLEIVNELYLFQLGPFGSVICEEAEQEWRKKYKNVTAVHIPKYIDLLIKEIESDESRAEYFRDLNAASQLTDVPVIRQYLNNR